MMNIVYFEGVKAKVRIINFTGVAVAFLAIAALTFVGCSGGTAVPGQTNGEVAATVNGKAINLEEVERAIKAQGQGQEAKASPLELAQARLQVLQQLIQQEVMYQKADAEKTVPTDDEVTAEFNKRKTASGKSAEEIAKGMSDAGQTEETAKDSIKKEMAINKLIEKITSKIDAPKDSEIEGFYKGNPDAFVKKKGVKLAAIVVDPTKSGDNDTTVDEASAAVKIKDIAAKLNQNGDFAAIARENSEDPSAQQGGDLGTITEEQLKQSYPQLLGFMNPQVPVGKIAGPFNIEGKFFIFKLQERSDKDETQTLESPGVRQQITDALTNGRKNLVSQAYMAQAINEAKIDNRLLKKIIDNPNELSGARPASTDTPNANANTNANTAAANTNTNAKPAANTNAKPANTKPAPANTKPAANTAAPTKANTK